MSLFLNQTIYYAYNIARCSSKQRKRSNNNNNNNNNNSSKNNKFKTYNKFYFFWEGPNAYNMHRYQQSHTTTTHTPMLHSLLNWCQFNTKIKHANSKPLGRKQNLRMHPKVFLSCIGICSGSFTGPSALCNTGNWFKLDCCTNATSISVCSSSTAHSSSQSRSKQCASYSVWVALAGCYTFFNILQCSNDKCKRAVRIWVVIADNFTMLAMLASIYFICVDCMNGRPKMSSLGGVAKGNLWPFDFMTAHICGIPKTTLSKHVKTLLFTRSKSRMHSNVETQSFLNCDMIKMSTYFPCVQVLTVQKCKCEIETRWNPLSMSSRNLSQIPHVDLPPSSPKVDWQTCQVQSVAEGKDSNIQRLYQRSRPLGYKSHCPAPQAKAPH